MGQGPCTLAPQGKSDLVYRELTGRVIIVIVSGIRLTLFNSVVCIGLTSARQHPCHMSCEAWLNPSLSHQFLRFSLWLGVSCILGLDFEGIYLYVQCTSLMVKFL